MSKTHIPIAFRRETESRFNGRCAFCRSPFELMNVTFEVDHIIPEKRGGLTRQENLAYTCPLCNAFKAARIRGTDPVSRQEVLLFHPRKQNWERHFRWSADQITIEGRTKNGRATVSALQLNNPNLTRLRIIWLAIGSSPPGWLLPELTEL